MRFSWNLRVDSETLEWNFGSHRGNTWEELINALCQELLDYEISRGIEMQLSAYNKPLPKGVGWPPVLKRRG